MSKKTKIVSVVGGLALGLTANFGLAQGQQNLEVFSLDFAGVSDAQVSSRANTVPPPFNIGGLLNLNSFDEANIPENALETASTTLVDVQEYDVKVNIVDRMRASSIVSNSEGNKVIGLHSSMVKQKKNSPTEYDVVTLYNGDDTDLNGKTDHNLSWYPDWKDVDVPPAGYTFPYLRLTVGDFYPGKMPFPLRAHLKIPVENLKWEDSNKTKLWFKARMTTNAQGKKVSPLDSQTNYMEVGRSGHLFSVPISEIYGYWDQSTGEWKIKLVVDSDLTPPQPFHPVLNMRFYSKGTPLSQ